MKIAGIVCEYNPFHTGHMRQIDILRKSGAELIICAMSGNYTERGELAIADKYTRAEAAISCGADIVLELPFPFSSFSAEGFARAGVHILASAGIDTLCFGSECADINILSDAADVISSPKFVSAYTKALKECGAAKAYFDTLSHFLGKDAGFLSNDILAISYISALKSCPRHIGFMPIKREGAAYTETDLGASYPSATAIRKLMREGSAELNSLDESILPRGSFKTLSNALKEQKFPVSASNIQREIISFFRLMTPDDIIQRAIAHSGGGSCVADDGCGIVDRICRAAKDCDSLETLMSRSYNSRYTDARINRVLLFSLFGVSNILPKVYPEFSVLLAANAVGRNYLSSIRKTSDFPIITKPADSPEGAITEILRASDRFYACAMGQNDDYFVKKHPFMG